MDEEEEKLWITRIDADKKRGEKQRIMSFFVFLSFTLSALIRVQS